MLARIALGASILTALLWTPSAALADKRVALVIGNSNYARVAPLASPQNDAAAVAALLKTIGFETVHARNDLDITAMRRVLRDFAEQVRGADVALVYYAGHGIEVNGLNYLVAVDGQLERDTDVEDEAIPVDRLMRTIEPARRLRLIILDACRDNPFARTMRRTVVTRSTGRGLSRIEPESPNTLIAFAAKAGSVALDGDGTNSPFTRALLDHIATPGLDIRLALGKVRDDVLRRTGQQQEPFVYGSLGGSIVSLFPQQSVAPPDPATEARRDYDLAAAVSSREAWDTYLQMHSRGFYAELARAQRAKLIAADRADAEAAAARSRAEAAEQARVEAEATERAAAAAARAAAEKTRADAKLKAAAEAERAWFIAAEKAREEAEARARVEAEQQARSAAEQAKAEQRVAALTVAPGTDPPVPPAAKPDLADVTRLLQAQLRRVGCEPGGIDGQWTPRTRSALEAFNRHSGMKLDARLASLDTLNAVKARTSRVCPLVCPRGQRAERERCVAIEEPKPRNAKEEPAASAPRPQQQGAAEPRGDLRASCSAKARTMIASENALRGWNSVRHNALFSQCMASGGKL